MDIPTDANPGYRFGDFRLDTRRHLLFSGSDPQPIRLSSKAFDALDFLIRHRDRVVDKATLMREVWPGVVVEDNNLNQVITALRRAFGEQRGDHDFIITVPGRGYRFVAQVREADETHHVGRSLGVLPFVNLTGDPEMEYFGDGMAEELIHMLTRVPDLRVPSRTSSFAYKGRAVPLRDIARDLNVATLLEGSVRSAGERIRVTAQLIDAAADTHIWSQTFDRQFTDIFELQDELAKAIAQAVGSANATPLPRNQSAAPPTQNVQAYRLYLQGIALTHTGNEPNYQRALELFRQAIELDPSFARAICAQAIAQAGTATEYRLGTLQKALRDGEAGARRALQLDPSLAEAENLLGTIHAHRLEWLQAETRFRRGALSAAKLPRGVVSHDPRLLISVANTMMTGHVRQGREAAEETFADAPAAPSAALLLSIAYAFEGRDEEALQKAALAEALGWTTVPLPMIKAQIAQRAGHFAEAGRNMKGSFPPAARAGGMDALVDAIYHGLAEAAKQAAALLAIRNLVAARWETVIGAPSLPMLLMQWSVCLGDIDLGYEIGQRTIEQFAQIGCMPVASFIPQLWLPEMLPFRRDPRFHDFAGVRLRLLDFWKEFGPPDGCELRSGRLVCLQE